MDFRGYNPQSAANALAPLSENQSVFGLSDGRWGFVDALWAILKKTGPADVAISTWTAAGADIEDVHALIKSALIRSVTFFVDRSFVSRQGKFCAVLRNKFGDDSIRLWDGHAKFALIQGQNFSCVYLTSANLNKNPRIENFQAHPEPEVVAVYAHIVDQAKKTLFSDRPELARKNTRKLFSILAEDEKGGNGDARAHMETAENSHAHVRARNSPRALSAKVRRELAMLMRIQGDTIREISETLKKSESQIKRDIKRVQKEHWAMTNENIENHTRTFLARLEGVIGSLQQKVQEGTADTTQAKSYEAAAKNMISLAEKCGMFPDIMSAEEVVIRKWVEKMMQPEVALKAARSGQPDKLY